jgi:hypothetical protein
MMKKRGKEHGFVAYLTLQWKICAWWPGALSTLVLGGLLVYFIINHAPGNTVESVLEAIIPIAFGLHAAFIFSPDSDPSTELLLSYPKTMLALLGDRLLAISLLHMPAALLATAVVLSFWRLDGVINTFLGWFSPALLLAGIAIATTQLTRQTAFGALLTTLLWGGSFTGGEELLRIWPWTWPLQVYLQPSLTTPLDYLANRLILILFGGGLFFLAGRVLLASERALVSAQQ